MSDKIKFLRAFFEDALEFNLVAQHSFLLMYYNINQHMHVQMHPELVVEPDLTDDLRLPLISLKYDVDIMHAFILFRHGNLIEWKHIDGTPIRPAMEKYQNELQRLGEFEEFKAYRLKSYRNIFKKWASVKSHRAKIAKMNFPDCSEDEIPVLCRSYLVEKK